ncbi:MAG TPA: hypothetical protein VE378_04635 [Nitrososphaeraceae archaeon]|jgi:protein subunit release factor A|nr:hypothetical protein [Nitrososphaeraceae archaeon]
MAYTEEQVNYIIELGKLLEHQRLEQHALEAKEVQRLIDKAKEVMDKYRKLKQVQKDMKDGPSIVVLPDGTETWSDQVSLLTLTDEPTKEV